MGQRHLQRRQAMSTEKHTNRAATNATSGAGWSLDEQAGEMNRNDIRMLADSELDAVFGGAMARQTGGEIVVGTPAPAPQGPIPLPYPAFV
jgi:hypothetical protein